MRFECGLVPEAFLLRGRQFIHPTSVISNAERLRSWNGIANTEALVDALAGLLPGPRRIDASQLRWEDSEGTSIDVYHGTNWPRDLTVSIDVRVPRLSFTSELSLLANRHQWLAVMPDGRIFRPCVRRFLAEIHHARAMQWTRGVGGYRAPRTMKRGGEELACE